MPHLAQYLSLKGCSIVESVLSGHLVLYPGRHDLFLGFGMSSVPRWCVVASGGCERV